MQVYPKKNKFLLFNLTHIFFLKYYFFLILFYQNFLKSHAIQKKAANDVVFAAPKTPADWQDDISDPDSKVPFAFILKDINLAARDFLAIPSTPKPASLRKVAATKEKIAPI